LQGKELYMIDIAAETDTVDVVIVGGGPAGLNAALVLGRCRRNVLLFDDGKPRNAVSHALHGFLSRDGTAPSELRAIALQQLGTYASVKVETDRVVDAVRAEDGFLITTVEGRRVRTRKLLLAAGVVDDLPKQPGFQDLYGIGLFHCPYCDGWEMRDRPLAVYGRGDAKGGGLALEMTHWSRDIVLCTDGPSELSDHYQQRLKNNGVTVREEKIICLAISRSVPYDAAFDIIFETGSSLPRAAVFFVTCTIPRAVRLITTNR
jgi:thioredoxin reductase